MTINDEPITVPLGPGRSLLIYPTDNPDTITIRAYGRHTGRLIVIPIASNVVELAVEVNEQEDGGRNDNQD